jgi:hypothetical protein
LRAFLAEFGSLHAASDYLAGLTLANSRVSKVALISPAAQEYLQPAAPPRDPDTMAPPINSKVALPGWKLLFRSSHCSSEMTVEELTPAAEKALEQRLESFSKMVLERHRNAMVVRLWSLAGKTEQALACADMIAADHSFICAAITNRNSATVAFVPLTVDPPAAMHYADAVSQLRSRLGSTIRLRTVDCPREVWRYMPSKSLSAVSSLLRAIKRKFNRDM